MDGLNMPRGASPARRQEIIRGEIARAEQRLHWLKEGLAEELGGARPINDLKEEWESVPKGRRRGKASKEHLGRLITKAREAGHSPLEIAGALNLTVAYVYRLENAAKGSTPGEELL